MKIFTREYVETLAYTSISAFAVGRLAAELALKCKSPIVRTIVLTGFVAGNVYLSDRIAGRLIDYEIVEQSIEDGSLTVNQ